MHTSWKKTFTIIYTGQAFSLLGSAAVQFSLIWWLTVRTESAITLALASTVSFLPSLLLGPFAGVWVDRYNRRTVMIAADLFIALSSVALGVLFLITDAPPIWCLYLALFARGLGGTFHSPAMQAAIPMLVPAEMLTKAGGWGSLISSLSNMLGPVLGAALMGLFSMTSIMLVDVFGAAFAVICLLFVAIPDVPGRTEKVRVLADLRQGLRTMRGNRALMAMFLPLILVNLLSTPISSLFPLLVRTQYLGEAYHNSVVEMVFAGGVLASSAAMGIWGGMKKRFLMASLAIAVLGLSCAAGGALPAAGFWGFVLCCFLMGGSATFINVPLVAYVQETTAPEQMGKVMSLLMTAMTLSMPFGLLVAGPLSELIGVNRWFFWSGLVLAGLALLFFARTRRHDPQKA
ncbi:MAG: MFS transporter [Oscillospiraceae bacterium]|jgi:DHA3 family macrolide efflux protein-like MFS transporter|nr:MFS transporter [Oscillospiraceae bacterium]